jgi:hypothetical protein
MNTDLSEEEKIVINCLNSRMKGKDILEANQYISQIEVNNILII